MNVASIYFCTYIPIEGTLSKLYRLKIVCEHLKPFIQFPFHLASEHSCHICQLRLRARIWKGRTRKCRVHVDNNRVHYVDTHAGKVGSTCNFVRQIEGDFLMHLAQSLAPSGNSYQCH